MTLAENIKAANIILQAEKELEEELYREAVEEAKKKIKARKWWHKYMPYKIVFIRRN